MEVVGEKSDFVSTLKMGPVGCVALNKERKGWKDKVTIYEKRKPLCVVGMGRRWAGRVGECGETVNCILDILNMRCLWTFK